jgi:Tol biopolymer transport system component
LGGAPHVAASVPGSGEVWIASVAGGQPRRLTSGFTAARRPIWDRTGTHLLVVGYTRAIAFERASDWWVVPIDGSGAVRTGAYDVLAQFGPPVRLAAPIQLVPEPGCWAVDGMVTFSVLTGDSSNLWQLNVSPRTGKAVGRPQRLTTSSSRDLRPSCVSDRFVFSEADIGNDLWSVPFDLERGTTRGVPERVTHGLRYSNPSPSLTRNGRLVAFTSDQAGPPNIWVRDLDTGTEQSVAASPLVQRYPTVNASGAAIAFSVYQNDTRAVYVSAPGGVPERL